MQIQTPTAKKAKNMINRQNDLVKKARTDRRQEIASAWATAKAHAAMYQKAAQELNMEIKKLRKTADRLSRNAKKERADAQQFYRALAEKKRVRLGDGTTKLVTSYPFAKKTKTRPISSP